LHDAGGYRNSTSSAGLLKEQVPAYVQELFEERLGGRGFGLHELGVLAATIEHLVHNEAVKRLGETFKVHRYLPTSIMNESEADGVLDTYIMAYVLGEDLSNMTVARAQELKEEMPEIFAAWNATKQFVREVRKNISVSDASVEQQRSGDFDFSLIARVAERVGEQFGSFQNHECDQIKASLVAREHQGTGRVLLSDFWRDDDSWQFQESMAYLKQLGVLDESDPEHPRVMIANYVNSPSNCIASSKFYSVCCKDECEGLLGHLENRVGAPEARAERVAALVADLSSTSVTAPRRLSASLLSRLDEIASVHHGQVQLHGRLFAQWMHHAFPLECPYPHVSGTINSLTPDEWVEATGGDEVVSIEEKADFFEKIQATRSNLNETLPLPWTFEEELLVVRVVPQAQVGTNNTLVSFIRSALLFVAMVGLAYGMMQASVLVKHPETFTKSRGEKFLV
jgi:hypothetical protein